MEHRWTWTAGVEERSESVNDFGRFIPVFSIQRIFFLNFFWLRIKFKRRNNFRISYLFTYYHFWSSWPLLIFRTHLLLLLILFVFYWSRRQRTLLFKFNSIWHFFVNSNWYLRRAIQNCLRFWTFFPFFFVFELIFPWLLSCWIKKDVRRKVLKIWPWITFFYRMMKNVCNAMLEWYWWYSPFSFVQYFIFYKINNQLFSQIC